MLDPRLSKTRKSRHLRLWPLMFLPIVGLVGGLYFGREQISLPFGIGRFDPMESALLGLLTGCGLMVISASTVLAYRVARRQFTIRAIVVTIAVIAVLLTFARRSLP
jgi:hypothetical protein